MAVLGASREINTGLPTAAESRQAGARASSEPLGGPVTWIVGNSRGAPQLERSAVRCRQGLYLYDSGAGLGADRRWILFASDSANRPATDVVRLARCHRRRRSFSVVSLCAGARRETRGPWAARRGGLALEGQTHSSHQSPRNDDSAQRKSYGK